MIGKLKGTLEYLDGEMWGVATSSGVTYECAVPRGPDYVAFLKGSTVDVWVHTHVREDALDLFGFLTEMERIIFKILISVSGVGPKVAMNVLSALQPEELVDAILSKNGAAFTRVSGIGKKTAERLILELHDRVQKKVKQGEFKASSNMQRGEAALKHTHVAALDALQSARNALLSLGYRQQEAQDILERISNREPESGVWSSQDWIRESLKEIRSISK